MNIDLNSTKNLPDYFLDKLQEHSELFIAHEFSENLCNTPQLSPLVRELNNFCMRNQVIGIHFSRADKQSILSKGLLCLSGNEIRNSFLKRYGSFFSSEELNEIRSRWQSNFGNEGCEYRDFNIFFNFTDDALRNGGADELLGMFGGEQITMGFDTDSECPIGEKLANLGVPLIVKCSLDPSRIETYIENPWGKILMSSYHKELNSSAYRIDQDGHIRFAVPKADILEVITLN
jgi:hypothetical protein